MRLQLTLLIAVAGCMPVQAEPCGLTEACTAEAEVVAPPERAVTGRTLAVCSMEPLTGFFRDGSCRTGPSDRGIHTVCAEVTDTFLDFTASRGNDLRTPRTASRFPGLEAGDRWCLCAARWEEARLAGAAPPVVLGATSVASLRKTTRELLSAHAVSTP